MKNTLYRPSLRMGWSPPSWPLAATTALVAAGGVLWVGGRVVVLRRKNKQLWAMSYRDALTGAYNRRYLLEFLRREMARAHRVDSPLCLMMLDIDHFKAINDRHGHGFGDAVLVDFTRCIQNSLRGYDILSRIGGEEFVVVLTDTALPSARIVAERMRKSVAALRPRGETVTVSIGLVQRRPDEDVSVLLARADTCLYTAKRQGRNRVVEEP